MFSDTKQSFIIPISVPSFHSLPENGLGSNYLLILTFQTLPPYLPLSSLARWMKAARGTERSKIKKNRAINKCSREGGSADRRSKTQKESPCGLIVLTGGRKGTWALNSSVKNKQKKQQICQELKPKIKTQLMRITVINV